MDCNLRFYFLIFSSFLYGCTTTTPHENFKAHLFYTIGGSFADAQKRGWLLNDSFLKKQKLPNGNIETTYKYKGSCIYFFEIEKTTNKIVNAHFEGSEKDCSIAP